MGQPAYPAHKLISACVYPSGYPEIMKTAVRWLIYAVATVAIFVLWFLFVQMTWIGMDNVPGK